MREGGQDPFERPMRPSRIDLIRLVAEGFATSVLASDIAAGSDDFQSFQDTVTWSIIDALTAEWVDTTIAEIRAGMKEAEGVCKRAFDEGRNSPAN